MMRNYLSYIIFVIAVILFVSSASAQEKMCVISGVVKDARNKLPLNEAVITISSNVFKGQKFALTDSAGIYRVGNLLAGTYTISFEMEGYEKFTRENFPLQQGASVGVNFEMVREKRKKRVAGYR